MRTEYGKIFFRRPFLLEVISRRKSWLIFLWTFSLLAILSCQNFSTASASKPVKANLSKTTWVVSSFLDKLKQSKNPNFAANGINLAMIEFTDETNCKVIWNFYEGTDFTYTIREDTVELTDHSNRRFGQIVFLAKDGVLIDSKQQSFTKCSSSSIIESMLFAGRYHEDSTNNLVQFLENGQVINLEKLGVRYSCEYQNSLPDSNLNIIYIDNKKLAYIFQKNNDLEIFELDCSDVSDDETCVKGNRIALLHKND